MLFNLFKKEDGLIAIDIGASSIKLLELDTRQDPPSLVSVSVVKVSKEIFSGNALSKAKDVSDLVVRLMEQSGISGKRIVTAVPGPSVFTKKIKVPKMSENDLSSHIRFEAANFIPHNINAVRIDYHILSEISKSSYEVLVVAVKNEIIDMILDVFLEAQLEVAVIDVDHFALQNMFELSYPELVDSTIGLVNIGERYTSINICRAGESLFTGDIPVGGKLLTEAIAEGLGVSLEEAQELKKNKDKNSPYFTMLKDITSRSVDYLVSELNRHLSFFWNASGSQDGLDRILLTGGGALVAGLGQELSDKTGIECSLLNPLRGVEVGSYEDQNYLKEIAPQLGVCVGLALRYPGDRIYPSGGAK